VLPGHAYTQAERKEEGIQEAENGSDNGLSGLRGGGGFGKKKMAVARAVSCASVAACLFLVAGAVRNETGDHLSRVSNERDRDHWSL
jgi:hypothetical protein